MFLVYEPISKASKEISFVEIRVLNLLKHKLKIPPNIVQRDFCDTLLCILKNVFVTYL